MKSYIKIISVITGSIIGAGFASGQEIKIFFGDFGIGGLLGIIIATSLMALVVNSVLKIVIINKTDTYLQFTSVIFKNHKILNNSMKNIIDLFLLISFFLMTVGFASFFEQELCINKYIGAIIVAVMCYFTFLGSIKRIIKINELIMPILLLLIIILGIVVILNYPIEITQINKNTLSNNPITSGIIYASYNMIILIPILISLKSEIKSKKQIDKVSVITWFCIVVPAILIYFMMFTFKNQNVEIPIIQIANQFGNVCKYLYSFVILSAIFTSAVCSGYSFLKNITKKRNTYRITALVICIISIFVSHFSFSNLIKILYPFFGFLGIMQIFLILLEKKQEN